MFSSRVVTITFDLRSSLRYSISPGIILMLQKKDNGLVVPSGYSFNLDGTSIYLTIAAIFVAQATNTHLTASQEAMFRT